MPDLTPGSEAEAAAMVAAAAANRTRLVIRGGGTRARLGRPIDNATTLSTAGLTGVTLYEPAEMVVAARAGTPLTEIEALLAGHGQRLAFEPMDHRPLFGSTGEPTIGGVAACNVSGPRRIHVGAARDHLIGVRFVNGRGEVVKSGGRVMKNVTGLDLTKLSAGAYGTLGLLTEVTFKVLPVAEHTETLVFEGLADAEALALLTAALGSPVEVTAAAHLPAGVGAPVARTLLRLEGFAASVAYRADELRGRFAEHGTAASLAGEDAAGLWRQVRDGALLAEPPDAEVWRVSVAAAKGGEVLGRLGPMAGLRHYYDWGGGLIWLAAPAGLELATPLRRTTAELRGHATLIRATPERRATAPVFEPLAEPLMRLTAGLKASFDPAGILNFGRMYEGI
jgi:glycolate oxidase FAD binding subunit